MMMNGGFMGMFEVWKGAMDNNEAMANKAMAIYKMALQVYTNGFDF